tara:strand:- start:14157 stop:14540 length:384 start_codon:yes stop_codon:yes gene_type:complete
MIHVTAAIIEDSGKFLIAKRKKGKHLEGLWEFPGGKIEENESHRECLKRELFEEFGIRTRIKKFIGENTHDYENGTIIKLFGYHVEHIEGDFALNEHDEVQWVTIEEFDTYEFAPADIPLVKKLQND